MEYVERARLISNGNYIDFVVKDDPPKGCMKYTYFTPDKSKVVQFFLDTSQLDNNKVAERLDKIINRYNPTVSEELGGAKGNTKQTADYFRKRFCWPLDTVYHSKF